MDLSALISRFRILSGDHGVPPLWSDEDVTAFLNEAEREAAERARLLYDKTTEPVVQIQLLPGVRDYRLHPKVFDVQAAGIVRPGTDPRRHPVCRSSEADMRWTIENRPNLSGWAGHFFIYGDPAGGDGQGMHLVLDRKPHLPGGVLWLEVYRYPMADMEDGGDEPEVAPRHHDGLVHWALKAAYETRDMEGDAPQRAAKHEAEFDRRFGIREDANVMRKKARHRAPVTRPLRW